MPVEIRELVIKVNVNQPSPSGGEGSSSQPASQTNADQPPSDKVVADAVEQVLDIIKNKEER
ncbi:DUF5908 family protein [Spirosoma sp. KNUC1025]|uniref:DUF5908 family protein n=1 Tax=Spirosoma sp. KNUC1025 TaxID=2894082 RepID=UPI003863617B|nr:DUF5908 family protein [Spirosoma sp. KNUC1025]